jgi:superoxide dismutase, Fe-Mn family
MPAELPKLEYEYDALEPHIDALTMEIHHSKHHQGYTDKYNAAVAGTNLEEKDPQEVVKRIKRVPANIRSAIQNNGGGYVNHTLFWTIMAPNAGGEPIGKVAEAINAKWGNAQKFKEEFAKAAATQFGSGWAFLAVKDGVLYIVQKPNQDSPLSDGLSPILCLDVWEHAYYKKYGPNRAGYIAAWWNVVDWEEVNKNYEKAL